jgi:hypothetical protein
MRGVKRSHYSDLIFCETECEWRDRKSSMIIWIALDKKLFRSNLTRKKVDFRDKCCKVTFDPLAWIDII